MMNPTRKKTARKNRRGQSATMCCVLIKTLRIHGWSKMSIIVDKYRQYAPSMNPDMIIPKDDK